MEASPRLLILLLALGFNQQAEAKFNHFSGLSERAIIQARNETTILLDDAVQHPNATGRWPIIGIDVSKPLLDHPTTEDYGHGNGWSIDIAVATNVSTEGVTNSNPSRILLKAPENAFADLNSTTNAINNYSVCAVTWFTNTWTLGEIKKLNEDVDGSCNGVISTECIKDLKQTLAGQPCSRTSSFTKPESCKDALSSFSAFQSNVTFNFTEEASHSSNSSFRLFGSYVPYNNKSDEANTRDIYDQALTNVYPVLLTYNYDDGQRQDNYSVFHCVRANNIVEGSRKPETFGSYRRNSAGRATGSLFSLVVGIFVSVVITDWL
ncbi:hypothetical protein EsH8_I_001409 [Colletotrichum jinshuiense]